MTDDLKSQYYRVQQEFKKQATGWSKRQDKPSGYADLLDLEDDFSVLDVASGSGILASAFAPHVARVIASDLTHEMLEQAQMRNIENMHFALAAAEKLPVDDNALHRVVTRYSFHHMLNPQLVIQEMYRVCRIGGRVMVIDVIAPEESEVAELYNHLERLRDPSHTNVLSLSTLMALFSDTGFRDITQSVNPNGEMDLENWFDLAQTPQAERQQVLGILKDELESKVVSGFNPFYRDNKLKIVHSVATIVGTNIRVEK